MSIGSSLIWQKLENYKRLDIRVYSKTDCSTVRIPKFIRPGWRKMQNSVENESNTQSSHSESGRQDEIYSDEINLADYFKVLWKQKYFIILLSVLPALVVGITLFLWPRDYRISYTYDKAMEEKNFRTLEAQFYAEENLDRLTGDLKDSGFDQYAAKLANANNQKSLAQLISFSVSPSYFSVTDSKNLDQLRQLQKITSNLLIMNVKSKSSKDLPQIAVVCRKNFEKVIPLYSIRQELKEKIISLRGKLAGIENNRYTLNLELERKKATLEKLNESTSADSVSPPTEVVLQFDTSNQNSAYLPLAYQVQAAKTRIINLEEQIRTNKEEYTYYTDLLKLNNRLYEQFEQPIASDYTIEKYYSFLTDEISKYDTQQLVDHLQAYARNIENIKANKAPLVERPKVYPLKKGTVKKTGITFVAAALLSVLVAFLRESIQQDRLNGSPVPSGT